MDIEKEFGIKVEKTEKISTQNPFCTKEKEIINDSYFLTMDHCSRQALMKTEMSTIKLLKEQGVFVLSPLKVATDQEKTYQLFPYIKGNKEPKSEFTQSDIKELVDQLEKISKIKSGEYKSIKTDLDRISVELKSLTKLNKVMDHLNQQFFPYIGYMNRKFCHGDLHPGNIIWDSKLKAIIDWELSGVREELYDLAFLMGCLIINDPVELTGDTIKSLISSYVSKGKPSKLSVLLLPELVIAIRIMWLHKWHITSDDLLDMELALICNMTEHIEMVRTAWIKFSGTDFKYSGSKWVMQDSFIVKDIETAKERLKKDMINVEQYATDLRLMVIDYGMKDDIINVIKHVDILKKLSKDNPNNNHVLIETVLAMGNSCLDFSKFRMIDALEEVNLKISKIIENNNVSELNIGYAFVLRNSSIAYAEIEDIERSKEKLRMLIELENKEESIEIKGELARALSNMITTLLTKDKDDLEIESYYQRLRKLFLENQKSRKIHGAYQIAKANLNRSINI